MLNPMVCADGHSYEASNIRQWFARSANNASPLSGAQLANRDLFPNHTLRTAIEEYLEKHVSPELRDKLKERREFARAVEREVSEGEQQRATPPADAARANEHPHVGGPQPVPYRQLRAYLRAGLWLDVLGWGLVLGSSIRWLMLTSRWTWALATAWTLLIFYAVLSVCRKAARAGQTQLRIIILDAVCFAVAMTVAVFGGMGLFLEFQQRFLRMLERPTPLANTAGLYIVFNFVLMVLITLVRLRSMNNRALGRRLPQGMLQLRYGIILVLLSIQQVGLSILLQVLDPCPVFGQVCNHENVNSTSLF